MFHFQLADHYDALRVRYERAAASALGGLSDPTFRSPNGPKTCPGGEKQTICVPVSLESLVDMWREIAQGIHAADPGRPNRRPTISHPCEETWPAIGYPRGNGDGHHRRMSWYTRPAAE